MKKKVLASTKIGYELPIEQAIEFSGLEAGMCYMPENVDTLLAEDKEKRLIHVSVSKQKNFLLLRFENYYDTELNYQGGAFITTKRDKEFHGYGLKSIRYTVNKYDGAVSIDTKENWFDLKILIPMKKTASDEVQNG